MAKTTSLEWKVSQRRLEKAVELAEETLASVASAIPVDPLLLVESEGRLLKARGCDFREGFDQVISTATGWPFRAFRGDHWIRWSPPPAPAFPQVTLDSSGTPVATQVPMERSDSLWHVSDTPSGPWALPYAPMWAGLAADLLAFGTFWLLVLSFSGLRRTLRRRRGLCTRCAYALKGLAPGSPCPECGQASAHSPSPDHSTT